MIKVRRAKHSDITPIVKYSRQAHEKSSFSALAPFSPAKARKNFTRLLTRPDFVILIAERDGETCGVLIGSVDEMLQCNARYAVDIEFYADGGGKELIEAFREWAKAMNCKILMMADSNGGRTEVKDRFYQGAGFEYTGGVYAQSLI